MKPNEWLNRFLLIFDKEANAKFVSHKDKLAFRFEHDNEEFCLYVQDDWFEKEPNFVAQNIFVQLEI